MSIHDLTGMRFGELQVLRKNKQSKNGGASWVCQCSCGRIAVINGYDLLNGYRKCCCNCNYGTYLFHSDFAECILPTGESFKVDREDYGTVSRYRWVTNAAGYFVTSLGKRNKHIFLHQLVLKPPEGKIVDHIDGDKTNCRKENLRLCTYKENAWNSTLSSTNKCGYKGVYWASDRKKWRAEITVDGKHIHIGSYNTAEEAARAYDEYALFYFGEFAKTNAMMGIIRNNQSIAV